MIRARHMSKQSLLSVPALATLATLAAFTAMLAGCVVGGPEELETSSAIDDLLDPAGNEAAADPEEESTDSADGAPLEELQDYTTEDRLAGLRDVRQWGQGEPRPIPWQETTSADQETTRDPKRGSGGRPPPSDPSPPDNGR